MVGLATRLVIADRARDSLPATQRAAIDAHPQWFALGALGPALGDFFPSEPAAMLGSAGRTPYWGVWREVLKIAVGDTASGLPGAAPVLRSLRGLLDQVSAAVAAEDKSALQAIVDGGAVAVLDQASADLTVILQQFSDPSRLLLLGQLMGSASRPRINDPLNSPPPRVWTGRDVLHWRRTGAFTRALRERAEASGDPRLVAYSRGWQVAYAGLTAGSGFVNSAVGSCYRTHWWRHRWVGNFVDTWTWGFYGAAATMSGDTPSPPFADWPALCDARLHERVDVTSGGVDHEAIARAMAADEPLPELLPTEFVTYWTEAFHDVYGSEAFPLTRAALQKAYAALSTVLWFQTSGDVVGCNPVPGPPPGDCGSGGAPDWIDPTQINPATGEPFLPAPPSPQGDPDVAEIVSGVILALLGLGAAALGGWLVGAGALVGGIALIVDGATEPDWDDLRCDVHWLRVYLFNGLTALHNLTVLGGVQHPYPRDLAVDQLVLSFGGASLPYTSGAAVAKSRVAEGLRRPWGGVISTWTGAPTEPLEAPQTTLWPRGGEWPSAMVDDIAANPVGHRVVDPPPGPWPGGVVRGFGPAVQAAVDTIVTDPTTLPDWNLDADRGLGWLTWELATPYAVPVAPAPVP